MESADEGTWLSAHERRVARALGVANTPLPSEETASAVGIKRSSIGWALESLVSTADAIDQNGSPRLTDPVFAGPIEFLGEPLRGEDPGRRPSCAARIKRRQTH